MPPKNKTVNATPNLKQQYKDLCDDEEDTCLETLPSVDANSDCISHESSCVQDVPESMDLSTEVLEGSWFGANKSKRSHAASDTIDDVLGTSPHLSPVKKKRAALPSLPANKTQLSDNSLTVLIAQTSSSVGSLLGEDSKRFTLDPVALSRGLKAALDFSVIKDVRVNKHRNIVAVEFTAGASSHMDALLALPSIGSYSVRSYLPSARRGDVCRGVIGPIHEDVNIDELLPSVTCDGFTVVELTRLPKFKGGSKEMSRAVKICFSGQKLPPSVKVDFMSYPVREFRDPPLRCYKCQRLGHLAGGCTASPRCLVCGGAHLKESCQASVPRCVNCGGPHVASSRECTLNQDASRVDALVRGGLPFASARRRVAEERRNVHPMSTGPPLLRHVPSKDFYIDRDDPSGAQSADAGLSTFQVEADVHNTQGSYYIPRRFPRRPLNFAAAALSQASLPGTERPSSSVAVEALPFSQESHSAGVGDGAHLPSLEATLLQRCQREILEKCEETILQKCSTVIEKCQDHVLRKCQDAIASTVSSLFAKLSALLVEVFSLNLHQEGKKERQMLLIGMVRNHFGPQISDPLLERHRQAASGAVGSTGVTATPASSLRPGAAPSGPVKTAKTATTATTKPATRPSTRK